MTDCPAFNPGWSEEVQIAWLNNYRHDPSEAPNVERVQPTAHSTHASPLMSFANYPIKGVTDKPAAPANDEDQRDATAEAQAALSAEQEFHDQQQEALAKELADEKLESQSWRAKAADKGESARRLQAEVERLSKELEEANYWRHNYADSVKTVEAERDAAIRHMETAMDKCNQLEAEIERLKVGSLDGKAMAILHDAREQRDAAIARAEKAERERANQTYRGNSVGWWHQKATTYGNMVHGIAPRLGAKDGETLVEAADRFVLEARAEVERLRADYERYQRSMGKELQDARDAAAAAIARAEKAEAENQNVRNALEELMGMHGCIYSTIEIVNIIRKASDEICADRDAARAAHAEAMGLLAAWKDGAASAFMHGSEAEWFRRRDAHLAKHQNKDASK